MAFNWIKTRNGDGNGILRDASGKLNAGGNLVSGLMPLGAAIHAAEGAGGKQNKHLRINANREITERLAKENALLNSDPNKLGLTDAEKQQQVADATQQASAQVGNQNQQLGQMALAGQGFQQGAFANAAADGQQNVENVAASAAANAEADHLQKIEMARERIMQGLVALRASRQERRKFYADYAMAGAQTAAEVFGGPIKKAVG